MKTPVVSWQCGARTFRIGARPLVMGILNVTPDSFSDGGRHATTEAAVRRGLEMAAEGADIIDVGGESTRPGAEPVPETEEMARVIPVIRALAKAFTGGAPALSVDTRKAVTADAALGAGAVIVNDVTALAGDPEMVGTVRRHGAGAVLMHMKGEPATMQRAPHYDDVTAEVSDYLAGRLAALQAAGLDPAALALDPGIGFGKTADHNLKMLAGLPALVALGRPVVVGVSRKKFIGVITGRDPDARMAGSLAAAVWSAFQGAGVWRVHDVKESVDAARMMAALREEMVEWTG